MSSTSDALAQVETVGDEYQLKWFGEPVTKIQDKISEIACRIPLFERRPFSCGWPKEASIGRSSRSWKPDGENKLLDLIVRMPLVEGEVETPVGAVSKHYSLVQHRDLFGNVKKALKDAGISLDDLAVELMLTAYGSKLALTFTFPEKYAFDPGDGQEMTLRLFCFNSVDARSRLTLMLGWFRFVCENGLVLGTSQLNQRFIHNAYLELPDLMPLLTEAIALAEKEKATFSKWLKQNIQVDQLVQWTDTVVSKKWGPLAAARVFLICRTGYDGRFEDPFEKAPPHSKRMKRSCRVPGVPAETQNAFDVCQALSWVVKERKDIQQQVESMRELPELMEALLRKE